MRWLGNGNTRRIGQLIFLFCLVIAMVILFSCCINQVPIHIKESVRVPDNYDEMEVISNYWVKDDDEFMAYAKALAETVALRDGWARYKIKPLWFDKLDGSRRISGAVIYYWKEK